MASGLYNIAKKGFANGSEDWDTNTYKVMLVGTTYTFDPDHDQVSDINSDELSGTGYTGGFGGAGRKSLTTAAVNQDDANDRAELDADNISWTSLDAGTIGAMVVIREVSSDADSIPIAYIDNPTNFPLTTNGGNVNVTWNAEGILQLS